MQLYYSTMFVLASYIMHKQSILNICMYTAFVKAKHKFSLHNHVINLVKYTQWWMSCHLPLFQVLSCCIMQVCFQGLKVSTQVIQCLLFFAFHINVVLQLQHNDIHTLTDSKAYIWGKLEWPPHALAWLHCGDVRACLRPYTVNFKWGHLNISQRLTG